MECFMTRTIRKGSLTYESLEALISFLEVTTTISFYAYVKSFASDLETLQR